MSYIKCLIWDLDNTLWTGTLLEDPAVAILPEIREVVTTLDSRGILQSVASKNDPDDAMRRLEELGIAEYFVLPGIGWGPKSESVRAVADRLGFAHEAIAFIDDRPEERAEVSFSLPKIRCYPAEQAGTLTALPEFNPVTVTKDSRRRRQMYQAGFRRDAERAAFKGPDQDFLRSLKLIMHIDRAAEEDLRRVEELTMRTTQMNTTGVYYAEDTLRELVADPGHEVLTMSLSDRFGPYGAVGMLLLERYPTVWHIKLLATSCRVASLGAGALLLNWLNNEAARAGVHLLADFRPTDRNRIMEVTYRFAGFDDDPCSCHDSIVTMDGEINRLHRTPVFQELTDTIELHAADLGEAVNLVPGGSAG